MTTATTTTDQPKRRGNLVSNVVNIKLSAISPDPEQPRKTFDTAEVEKLANSLAADGLLQPISVRPHPEGDEGKQKRYLLISGERRFRAAMSLGWEQIPSIVHKDADVRHMVRLQLSENILRVDLNPVEEARALKWMMDSGYSLQELADATGIVPAQIPRRIQMLDCREDILKLVEHGEVKPSMAYDIATLTNDGQNRAMRAIQAHRLNTNEVNKLCHQIRAEENQTEMAFGEVSEEVQSAVKTFGGVFGQICKGLNKLQELEAATPGTLVQAFSGQPDLVESQIDEAMRGLGAVKRVLQDLRMRQMADESRDC